MPDQNLFAALDEEACDIAKQIAAGLTPSMAQIAAFWILVTRVAKIAVLKFCRGCQNQDLQDLVQTTVTNLYRLYPASLQDHRATYSSFVFTIARRRVIDRRRKPRQDQLDVERPPKEMDRRANEAPNAERRLLLREVARIAREACGSKEEEVILMEVEGKLTVAEAMGWLALPKGKYEYRRSIFLRKLRRKIS